MAEVADMSFVMRTDPHSGQVTSSMFDEKTSTSLTLPHSLH
jgi:hypothetical protein